IATVSNNAAVTLASGVTGASDVFTLGNATNHLTGGGGTSSITVNSFANSKVVLTQSSNYAGSWNILGRLQIDNDNELGNASNPVNIHDGGVFVVNGNTTSSRLFTCNDGFFSVAGSLTLSTGLGGGSGTPHMG